MVQTTKGPVSAPGGEDSKPEDRTDGGDLQAKRSIDLDEATWGQVMAQAQSQQRSPGEVVKQIVENAYGVAPQSGAYHSGQSNDPALEGLPDEAKPAPVASPSEHLAEMTENEDKPKSKAKSKR